MTMSPRFVVDLTLLDGEGNQPKFDDMSPEFVCDVRVLSTPFALLAFVEPIFPVPPTFPPDARPPGPCVNTTYKLRIYWHRFFYCSYKFINIRETWIK